MTTPFEDSIFTTTSDAAVHESVDLFPCFSTVITAGFALPLFDELPPELVLPVLEEFPPLFPPPPLFPLGAGVAPAGVAAEDAELASD